MLPVLEHSKRAKNSLIFQRCAKCTITLMSNYEVTCSIFLQSYWVSDNVLHNRVWFPFQAPIRSSQYFQAKFPKFRPINFDGHKNNDLHTSFSEKEELRVPQKTSIFEKIVAWLSSFTHSFRRTVSFIIAQLVYKVWSHFSLVSTYVHCKCLQGFTGTLQGFSAISAGKIL